ncbi:hypothetical protein JCM1840_000350 [Sporobolomyces johnsonii]
MARLDLARAQSEEAWLRDLASLKADAGSRFGDVAWAAEDSGRVVYAHKCIVYARATGNWQQRFMGVPHSLSESNLSLYGQSTTSIRTYTPQSMIHPGSTTPTPREDRRSPSPSNSQSSTPSALRPIPLGPTDIDVFETSLEYFYTAGKETEAFAVVLDGFLDGGPDEAEDLTGIPKLRQDLLFCWRSKLYSDVEIALTAPDGSASTPFAAHRAILASRAPYFRTLLLGNFGDSRLDRFTLPSPPFTPASTTFVLGYIYTGTLDFSNRNFDLTTGFEIWRCAAFLSMSALQDEIESKVSAMLTPQRAPRIFSFGHAPDVNSTALAKLALPLVLEHFDEMWATPYIGNLEYDPQDQLVKQLRARIAPKTVARLARQTSSLRKRIELERAGWARNVEAMVDAVEEKLVTVLAEGLPEIVVSPGFIDLIDGVGFSTDVLEWILALVVKGLREEKAPTAYQALVGSVLLREARILVEDARNGILKYIKRKWISIRGSGGFDHLESWCLKELADELEVSTEDLLGGARHNNNASSRSVHSGTAAVDRQHDLPSLSVDNNFAIDCRLPLNDCGIVDSSFSNSAVGTTCSSDESTCRPNSATTTTVLDCRTARSSFLGPSSGRRLSHGRGCVGGDLSASSAAYCPSPFRPCVGLSPAFAGRLVSGEHDIFRPATTIPYSLDCVDSTIRRHAALSSCDSSQDNPHGRLRGFGRLGSNAPPKNGDRAAVFFAVRGPQAGVRELAKVDGLDSFHHRSSCAKIAFRCVDCHDVPPAAFDRFDSICRSTIIRLSLQNRQNRRIDDCHPSAAAEAVATVDDSDRSFQSFSSAASPRQARQWVGVEVAESAIPVEAKGLAWNDGKKDGLEYFALSPPPESSAPTPEPSDPTVTAAPSASTSRGAASATASLRPPSRRARRSSSAEPDSNGPRKGLFVRPNQIVYVL